MPASITLPVTETPVEMTAPVTEIAAPAVAETTAQACKQAHSKPIANNFNSNPPILKTRILPLGIVVFAPA